MSYIQTDITTFQRTCQTPLRNKTSFDTSTSTLQQQPHVYTHSRDFQSEQCPKAGSTTPESNRQLVNYHNYSDQQEASEESLQEWAEIKQIVRKICKLQSSLVGEKKCNKELMGKLKQYETKIKTYEEDIKSYFEQSKKNTEKYQNLLSQLKQQHENLRAKDDQLSKSKETLSQIQMGLLKRISESQQKLKKANIQNKELTQKLRKSNIQLQKQRNWNRQLKKEMASKIENMQSSKETYLIQQINNLKAVIDCSKDEKESSYLQQIGALNHRIYHYEQKLKIANIQINLMQRKKQQAIKDICDKKDQEVKVQKAMLKTLNEKIAKMHEEFKKQQKDRPRYSRTSGQRNQEEFLLELSPEKC